MTNCWAPCWHVEMQTLGKSLGAVFCALSVLTLSSGASGATPPDVWDDWTPGPAGQPGERSLFPTPIGSDPVTREEANRALQSSGEQLDAERNVKVEMLSPAQARARGVKFRKITRSDAAASAATYYTTKCEIELWVNEGATSPDPPAQGNPFAVARASHDSVVDKWTGYVQADVTEQGFGEETSSPVAQSVFSAGFHWPDSFPLGGSVSISIFPTWRGAFALESKAFQPFDYSHATGEWSATHAWYDQTINSWTNVSKMHSESKTAQSGNLEKFVFERSVNQGPLQEYAIGTNLQPSHNYYYYVYDQAKATVEAGSFAPGGAAVDFGSKDLDTPANIYDEFGNLVRGYFSPGNYGPIYGGRWATLTFTTPNEIAYCGMIQ